MTSNGYERPEAQAWFRGAVLCRECGRIYETIGPGPLQRCGCMPRDEDRWPDFDFNERIRLCDCCAGTLLRSGSRFSCWFCEECRQRVLAYNRNRGAAVIPIGRHSLMNFGPPETGEEPVEFVPDPATAAARFHADVVSLGSRIDVLDGWKSHAIACILDELVVTEDIGVLSYLELLDEARDHRPDLTPEAAFAALATVFDKIVEREQAGDVG